jgi:hypothetical protein
MAHTAASLTRYTIRQGAGATVRVQKWTAGQKVSTYFVEPKGWWQTCTCPGNRDFHRICRHIRLTNLLDAGKLGPARYYVWERASWVAGEAAGTASPRQDIHQPTAI